MQKFPTITPDEYIYLSDDEKELLHEKLIEYQTQKIEQAYKDRLIDDYDKDFLLDAISNSPQKIKDIRNFIIEILGKNPIGIYIYDPHNDKIATDSRGNPIKYGNNIISPLLNICLEFTDENNDPLFVYIAIPKSIERAAQKLNGKYDKICHQEEKN